MLKNLLNMMGTLILLAIQTARAETAEFAFVADLSEGKQSLRQFELPYAILTKLERPDYSDMRIFNSQNQAVPFSIRQLETQSQQNNASYDLRFFRLANNITQSNGLQIELNENTAHFSFNAESPQQSNYLIIENQHQSDSLSAIKLAWQQPSEAFSINATLESSDELQNWQSINTTTLYALKYLDTALTQNILSLPYANHAKYLRLSFQSSNNFSLRIDKITGDYQHTTFVEHENWQTVHLEPGDNPNEWLFNTGGYVPVTKISFEIPSTGLFYRGSLYAKNDRPMPKPGHPGFKHEVKRALHRNPEQRKTEQDNWRYLGAITQYRLSTAAGEIASQAMNISTTKERQWKLVLDQPATLLPEQIPGIKIAWQPVVVNFLAQGNPPFQLFFGNAVAEPFNTTLSAELNDNAETVNTLTIRPVEQTSKPIKLELNWQKILLWLILCVGVAVIGLMAYQLYLRINLKKS
jgi:hypothetical protein